MGRQNRCYISLRRKNSSILGGIKIQQPIASRACRAAAATRAAAGGGEGKRERAAAAGRENGVCENPARCPLPQPLPSATGVGPGAAVSGGGAGAVSAGNCSGQLGVSGSAQNKTSKQGKSRFCPRFWLLNDQESSFIFIRSGLPVCARRASVVCL